MSQLERPRIHFAGSFQTNVGTGNNDDTARPPVVDVATVGVDTRGMTDDQFRAWMEGTTTAAEGESPGEVRSGWNYYGDNSCGLVDAAVTSVELPGSGTAADASRDPLIGAGVTLDQAVMVDLDPTGYANTQIFADRFEIATAQGASCRAENLTTAFSRWISFHRNLGAPGFAGAAAVFQCSAAAADVEWQVDGSPFLAAVRDALHGAHGITIRFCLYLMSPSLGNEELAARFAAGDKVTNPAVGRVVGTVGPWLRGETATVAMGRLLLPSTSTLVHKMPVRLGPAVARVDGARHIVALDLVNTFPEADARRRKEGFGKATLRVSDGHRSHDLGPVHYDKASYEATSGVVEVAFDPSMAAAIAGGDLTLHVENGGVLLREASVMLESDDRCVYVQEGHTANVHLVASTRGAKPPAATKFFLLLEPRPGPDGPVVEVPDAVEVGTGQRTVVPVKGTSPGVTIVRFSPVGAPGRFDATRESFVSVRVLPADDFRHVGDDQLTFALVYDKVLRYYHLLHPAMSAVFDLSNEDTMKGVASLVASRVDPQRWSRWAYMPRTRELSDGKRRLLLRWCQKAAGG